MYDLIFYLLSFLGAFLLGWMYGRDREEQKYRNRYIHYLHRSQRFLFRAINEKNTAAINEARVKFHDTVVSFLEGVKPY